ncbi:MAG: DUF3445 domain-containing protein [Rhizobiaceae bacterium]
MTMPAAPDKHSLAEADLSDFHRQLAPPFTIGLKPLADGNFLHIDEDFLSYRDQKQALYGRVFDEVCIAEPGTLDAQREVEELVIDKLKSRYPHLYEFSGEDGSDAVCQQTGTRIQCNRDMPLSSAALLIPDDLVLMRRDDSGWRLVAGSMAFPASWSLAEKMSRPLEAVHGPVPLSAQMSLRINRIFDGLQPSIPVWRTNWSLDQDDELRQSRLENQKREEAAKINSNVYFRTEFQTLYKLPESKDILFTIHTKTRPVSSLTIDNIGRQKLAALHRQYLDMSEAEREYKGINRNADGLLAWLEENGRQ